MLSTWTDLLTRYPNPWPILGLSFGLSLLLTGLLYGIARSRHLMPAIRSRDVHTVRKPRVGGIGMWLALMICFAWILAFRPVTEFGFGRPLIAGIDQAFWGIIGGMVVLLIMGMIDDVKGLPWFMQLAGQLAVALILVASDVTIPYITLPSGGQLVFNSFWSAVFTVFWTLLVINVMNWFDGLDGLAGTIALTASLALFFVSLQVGFIATATLSLAVFGVSAGFLFWNWYPSKLFMGTVGSQMLGFLLAVIAIISGGKVATAVLVLGMPVMDAVIVVVRRLLAQQSPFQADQRHLHHRLLKIGVPVPWIVIIINGIALVFGALAIALPRSTAKAELLMLLVACMIVFILITYYLERRAQKVVH